MNLGTLVVTLTANVAGLTRASSAMYALQRQTMYSSAAMSSSLIAFGAIATAAFGKYESILAKMTGLTSFSSKQVRQMSNELLQLATQINQKPVDLAEGLYFIGSSGIQDAKLAMEVLKVSAKASAVGLGEVKTVADAVTSVLNAYGKENITAAQATDILVTAVREGKGEADALSRVIGKVMPLAVQLGVSFDEVAGSLAALTLTGKSAAEASTQMARLFTTLIQAPPRAEKALENMGISFAEIRRVLREGGTLQAIKLLRTMVDENKLSVIESSKAYEDNISVLGDVFTNIRALLPVLDMVGPNFANTARVLDATAQAAGSLNRAMEPIENTIKFRFGNALKGINVALIKFGDVIKEPLIGLIQKLSGFIQHLADKFQGLDTHQKNTILTLGIMAATLGPLLLVLSKVVGAVVGLGRALFGLSLFNIISQLLLLGAAIYYTYKNWDMFKQAIKNTDWKSIDQGIHDLLQNRGNGTPEKVQKKWEEFMSTMKNTGQVTEELKNAFESLPADMQGKFANYFGSVEQIQQKINAKQIEYNSLLEAMKNSTDQNDTEQHYLKIVEVLGDMVQMKRILIKADATANQTAKDDPYRYMAAKKQIGMLTGEYQRMLGVADEIKKKLLSKGQDIVTFKDFFAKVASDMATDVANAFNNIQKSFTGLDLMNMSQTGFGIGDTKNFETDAIKSLKRMEKGALGAMKGGVLNMPFDVRTKVSPNLEKYNQIATVFDNANKEMQLHQTLLEKLGINYDKTGDDVSTLQEAVSKLTSPEFASFLGPKDLDMLKQYLAQLDQLTEKQKSHRSFFRDLKNLWNSMSDVLGSYNQLLDSKKQKELDWIEKIAKAKHKSDKWLEKEQDKIQDRYAKKMKAIAIAQAVINGALAITNIWAHTIDVTGVGVKIAASALSAANTAIQIATIQGAKMATGGIVPQGYSNDTYPALLTSGEVVVPPKKLPELLGSAMGGNNQLRTVRFRIVGRDLIGVYEENRILNSTF